MKLHVVGDAEGVAELVANLVAETLGHEPHGVFALPTGRTPLPLYAVLAERHARGELDLSPATAFNLDELVLPAHDPRSFLAYMERHAWEKIGMRRERCHIPDTTAPDLDAECRRYEALLSAAGGLDLALLGLGADGHVAYNMPGPIGERTHVVGLPDGLAEALGIAPAERPLRALTMGLATIASARRIVVLATGPAKADAALALVRGADPVAWPCGYLTGHAALTVVLERRAAARL